MSANPTLVTKAHFEYVAAHTAGDDEFLRRLKREAEGAGIPGIWISPAQASLMQILLKGIGAKEVVEAGTLAGYSAIWMARALPPQGRVRTIEINPKHADFAERQVAQSDVRGRVQVLRGAAGEVLRTFESASADAAFLDADKTNYPLYLKECLRIVRPGGLIMADNAFAFGHLLDESSQDPEVAAIRAFNALVARTPELHAVLVPIGDGLWVSLKR